MLKTYPCGLCDADIAYVDCPGVPGGVKWATWNGWFHIDASKEHFSPVGFVSIKLHTNKN